MVKTYLKNISNETKLFIFSSCKNLIREIKSYRWNGSDSPIKKDDHALDELRYYIMHIQKENFTMRKKSLIQKQKEKLITQLKRKQ